MTNKVLAIVMLTFFLVIVIWSVALGGQQRYVVVTYPIPTATITKTSTPSPTPSPTTKKDLATIPFYVQAPFANWDALHEEACEEASTLMIYYWKTNQTPTLDEYDTDIKKFVDWQTKHGYGVSLRAEQLQQAASDYMKLTLRVKKITVAQDIIDELTAGHPVILPADGKLLGNPNYRDGGPIYHMLVIIGYKDGQFITNDPGTKKGEGYTYDPKVLLNALGNWDGSRVDRSRRSVLVFDQ